ncbi:MAG: hypothetical protein K9H25_23140 [Rhodospirillum sp.]|nr:hypothetical protein [Rhodospirillum sp.]MCF8491390.1 hypothetical protein [Rhodospirillum sp.]MCF8503156.1 hypothetical protein [Rhodospirillum sp.]
MSQKPIDEFVRLAVRVPRGQQGMWEIMRRLRSFTTKHVHDQTNIRHKQTVSDYIRSLTKVGFLEQDGVGEAGALVYRIVRDQPDAPSVRRDGSIAAPHGRGQDQMWRTMKMMNEFTARDIRALASTDDVKVTLVAAKDYLKNLHFAGYLQVLREAKPGHKPGTGELTLYRLLPSMNTGPLAPMVQRTQWVWDPNLRKAVGEPTEARNG